MRTGSKITLSTLLGLVNGYFLGVWRSEYMGANDVGRQWISLIIPTMMLVASVGVVLVVWLTDRLVGRGKLRFRQWGDSEASGRR
jgi:hypothetical protein